MELGGEFGRHPFYSSGVGDLFLYRVKVPDGPRHGEMHGGEIEDEALQIFDGYAPLAIIYLHKVDYL